MAQLQFFYCEDLEHGEYLLSMLTSKSTNPRGLSLTQDKLRIHYARARQEAALARYDIASANTLRRGSPPLIQTDQATKMVVVSTLDRRGECCCSLIRVVLEISPSNNGRHDIDSVMAPLTGHYNLENHVGEIFVPREATRSCW